MLSCSAPADLGHSAGPNLHLEVHPWHADKQKAGLTGEKTVVNTVQGASELCR